MRSSRGRMQRVCLSTSRSLGPCLPLPGLHRSHGGRHSTAGFGTFGIMSAAICDMICPIYDCMSLQYDSTDGHDQWWQKCSFGYRMGADIVLKQSNSLARHECYLRTDKHTDQEHAEEPTQIAESDAQLYVVYVYCRSAVLFRQKMALLLKAGF